MASATSGEVTKKKFGGLNLVKKLLSQSGSGSGDSADGSGSGGLLSPGKASKWDNLTRKRNSMMALDRLRKKRDGTPEKSLTPSLEADDALTPTRNVIWNEEIQKLQIRQDDLHKVWPPRPPSTERQGPPPVKVPVKKMKKVTDADKPKSRIVSVAKPAPPDAPIKEPDYSGYAGPRYDPDGHVVMHSLLGTYEDFHREASKRGDLAPDVPDPSSTNLGGKPSLKYEKKKRSLDLHHRRDENRALEHWQRRMMERKIQQGYISTLLQKAPEDLAMNQGDSYRKIQEQRYLIDRAIPKVDYGKGYRIGSEFWHQQEQFGDDLTGLHMTLTQAQRGYPAPVEHIGLSRVVKEEKGIDWTSPRQTPVNYPWNRSDFLTKRRNQLNPFMDELSDVKPDFENLQVIGSNVPYFRTMEEEEEERRDEMRSDGEDEEGAEQEDLEVNDLMKQYGDEISLGVEVEKRNEEDESEGQEKPVFGPSLLFGGQRARWMGDSFSLKNEVGIEARVTFEALTGDRITSFLELGNNGTTSIYYDWKKMSKENPFDLVQAQVQRFYFNNSSGVLLPGETLKFPFVFKSPNAGVFTEQWRLETRPVVCAGAALLVTLRGVAIQEDKFKKQREFLEKELVHRQAHQVVHHLLFEVVSGIRTPDRAQSPVDAYITEEEIFNRNNPGLLYNHELVSQLKQLHSHLYEDQEDSFTNVWGLSIQDLQQCILEQDDEDDEKKENYLHQMNAIVGKLTYIPHTPVLQRLEATGHQLFSEAIDSLVGQAMYLRHQMGLPSKELDEVDGEMPIGYLSRNSTGYSRDEMLRTPKSGDSRKGTRGPPEKGKPEPAKDKGGKAATGKDAKGAKGKEPKADAKGKTTPGPSKKSSTPVKASPAPAPTSSSSSSLGTAAATAGGDKDGVESFLSQPSTPEPGQTMSDIDLAATESLYRDTLMSQAYDILGDMVDRMDHLFSAIKDETNNA